MSEPFESQLPQGSQRFLAHVIEHGLERGRRMHEDFLRHFPPARIMQALADEPGLRSKIMVIATGVRTRIAVKQTPEQCASVLDIALEENETDAETIVSLFQPDDRVRFLPATELWAYVKEGEFWNVEADGESYDTVKDHLGFMLDRALADGVISPRDVIEGVAVDAIARHVPSDQLAKIIGAALEAGRAGAAFRDQHLLEQVSCRTLVDHLPLPTIWEGIVAARIAKALGVLPVALKRPASAKGPAEKAAEIEAPVDGEERPADVEAARVEVEVEVEIDLGAAPVPVAASKRALEPPRASLTGLGAVKKVIPPQSPAEQSSPERSHPVETEVSTGRKSRRPSAKPSRRSKRPSAPSTSGKVLVPGPGKS